MHLAELGPLLLGYTVKIFEIMDLWQRDTLNHHFFQRYLERHNGGIQSVYEVGTLPIVIGPGSI